MIKKQSISNVEKVGVSNIVLDDVTIPQPAASFAALRPGVEAGVIQSETTGFTLNMYNGSAYQNVVLSQDLAGFLEGAGTVSSADTTLSAFNKIVGNIALKANSASPTFTGTLTAEAYQGSSNMDVASTIRATNENAPASGSGLELTWNGTTSNIRSYNRTTPAYLPIDIEASNLYVNTTSLGDTILGGELFLSGALATGILKNTTTTGELSIAVAGDFPTLNQDTTGAAAKVGSSSFVAPVDTSALTANRTITVGDFNNLVIPNGFSAPFSDFIMTELGTDGNSTGARLTTDSSLNLNTSAGAGIWELSVEQATTSQLGGVELSTDAEVLAGSSTTTAVTPSNLLNNGCLSSGKAWANIYAFDNNATAVASGTMDIATGATNTYGLLSANGTTGVNLTLSRTFEVTVKLGVSSMAASGATFTITGTGTASVGANGESVGASVTNGVLSFSAIVTTTTGSPVITLVASAVSGTVTLLTNSYMTIKEL